MLLLKADYFKNFIKKRTIRWNTLVSSLIPLVLLFITFNNIIMIDGGNANSNDVKSPREWTIMVYMAADNDLESAGLVDLSEMKMASFDNETISVIVEFDGWESCGSHPEDIQTYSSTNRYFVPGNDQPLVLLESTEKNMGDPVNLREFIDYSIANYPASYYCLILWNHGNAWETGITDWEDYLSNPLARDNFPYSKPPLSWNNHQKSCCWDDRSFGDSLTEIELQSALSGLSLDIIAFDACLMGCIETAYAIKDYTTYMIASEDGIGLSGFYYTGFLESLQFAYTSAQDYSPEAFSIMIADETFTRQYSTGEIGEITEIAVCNLSLISGVATAINNLVPYITGMSNPQRISLCQAAANLYEYSYPEQVDLISLANEIELINSAASTAVANLISLFNNAIIWEDHIVSLVPSSNGLTIYFPWYKDLWFSNYVQSTLFGTDTNWNQAISSILSTGVEIPSNISPDNTDVNSYLSSGEEIYYPIKLYQDESVAINLTGDSGTDFDLYIYDSTQTTILFSSEEYTYPETISLTAKESVFFYINVYAYSGSGNFDLTTTFDIKNAKLDFLGCENLFPSYKSNGLINGIKAVLSFDSPEQTVVFFLSVMDTIIPFEITWTQTFERGYQSAVITIPCDYLYHFLSGSDPYHKPSSSNWESFGRLIVSDNNGNYTFDSFLYLRYLVKLSDLDPNFANTIEVSSDYPLIYVDPYGGDPFVLEPENTSTIIQSSKSYYNTNDFFDPTYFVIAACVALGGLTLVGLIIKRQISINKLNKGRRIRTFTPPSNETIQFNPYSQKVRPKSPLGYSVNFCPKCGGVLLDFGLGTYRCSKCGEYIIKR